MWGNGQVHCTKNTSDIERVWTRPISKRPKRLDIINIVVFNSTAVFTLHYLHAMNTNLIRSHDLSAIDSLDVYDSELVFPRLQNDLNSVIDHKNQGNSNNKDISKRFFERNSVQKHQSDEL